METTADDFLTVFIDGKASVINFLKRLHNFAVNLGWIAVPVVAPFLWPKYEPKERRGITLEAQQSVLAARKRRNGICFWNCFGKPVPSHS